MPVSSRLLYYDLGMNADDDGYAEWFTVVRMTGSAEQDLKVLEANGFVKIFDDNVLVILDWKENNYIRVDRYVPSKYVDKYNYFPRLPDGIPTGNQLATQVRLGKDRLGKEKQSGKKPEGTDGFDLFWELYPKKKAKEAARRAWTKLKPSPPMQVHILKAVKAAKQSEQWMKDGGQFIPHPATYLNGKRWEDEIEVVDNTPLVFAE